MSKFLGFFAIYAFIFMTCLFSSQKSTAADSLYQKALDENSPNSAVTTSAKAPNTSKKSKAFEATVQPQDAISSGSLLRLEDYPQEGRDKSLKWKFDLSLQSFGAEGRYTTANGSSAELSQVNKTIMPVFKLGFKKLGFTDRIFTEQMLAFGFAQQKLDSSVESASSTATSSALSSLLIAYHPTLGVRFGAANLQLIGEVGRLSSSHRSTSMRVNLNRSLNFTGYGVGAAYELNSNYLVSLNWIQRQAQGEAENQIQKANFDGGITYQW